MSTQIQPIKRIYSVDFLKTFRNKENCKFKENEIPKPLCYMYSQIINIGFPVHQNRWKKNYKPPILIPIKAVKPLEITENGWKPDNIILTGLIPFDEELIDEINRFFKERPPEIKKIKELLNKLSPKNQNKIIESIRKLNYTSQEIVEAIFKKAMLEPFFGELYAILCYKLSKLRNLIQEMCSEQFEKNKHKNLCKFIGELYKKKVIISIHSILNSLTKKEESEEIKENNIEILCTLIISVDPKRGVFEQSFKFLEECKSSMKPRLKFMIMDVIDYRSGKREPPKRTVKM